MSKERRKEFLKQSALEDQEIRLKILALSLLVIEEERLQEMLEKEYNIDILKNILFINKNEGNDE